MLHFDAQCQRQARAKADMVEAFAFGYSGVKTDQGARVMQQLLANLRG